MPAGGVHRRSVRGVWNAEILGGIVCIAMEMNGDAAIFFYFVPCDAVN